MHPLLVSTSVWHLSPVPPVIASQPATPTVRIEHCPQFMGEVLVDEIVVVVTVLVLVVNVVVELVEVVTVVVEVVVLVTVVACA